MIAEGGGAPMGVGASSDDRAAFFGRAASVSFANVDLLAFYATEDVSIPGCSPERLRWTHLIRNGIIDDLLARLLLRLFGSP